MRDAFGVERVSKGFMGIGDSKAVGRAKWKREASAANVDLSLAATGAAVAPLAGAGYNKYIQPHRPNWPKAPTAKGGIPGLRRLVPVRIAQAGAAMAGGTPAKIATHPATVAAVGLGAGVPLIVHNVRQHKRDSKRVKRLVEREKKISKKIVQQDGKYVTMSEDGSRKFGTYDTENKAKQRLHQVEYFKAQSAKKKSGERKRAVAVGAATAGGALAGQSAYMFPGSAFKNYYVNRKFENSRKDWTRKQKSAWFKHTTTPHESFRPNPKDPRTPGEQWRTSKEFFRKFPKELPTAGTRRVMGYAFKGKTGHAVAGTMMAGGALASYKVASKDRSKEKVAKVGTYVPKGEWSLKLIKDPGLMVPVAGVTGAGAIGTAAAWPRKKRKKGKK